MAAAEAIDILVVEDDLDTRESLRLILEMEGFACEEAAGGQVALEAARKHAPRIVLLDVMMPGCDGLEVMRQLRAQPWASGTQVWCLTGRVDPAVRDAATSLGCDQFFLKPMQPDELVTRIRKAIRPSEWRPFHE